MAVIKLRSPVVTLDRHKEEEFDDTGIRSLMRDFKSVGRIAGATVGEGLEMLGTEVPLTWEDLNKRDLKGAAMVGSLLASGGASVGMVKMLPALAKYLPAVGARGALGAATSGAAVETVAGGIFGLLRPLEVDATPHGALGSVPVLVSWA
jgi:hypothetical protein